MFSELAARIDFGDAFVRSPPPGRRYADARPPQLVPATSTVTTYRVRPGFCRDLLSGRNVTVRLFSSTTASGQTLRITRLFHEAAFSFEQYQAESQKPSR